MIPLLNDVFVKRQFYPLFAFYFPLFWGMVMYDNALKQRKIKVKPRIKLNHSIFTRAQLFKGRLVLNPGFLFFCSKAFSRIIFKSFQSSTCRQKELKLKCFFELSNLNSNLALTLGYLNPALNN